MEDYGYQSDNESCNDSDHALYFKKYSSGELYKGSTEKLNIFNNIITNNNNNSKKRCTVRDIILYTLAVVAGISLLSIPLCLVLKSNSDSFNGCISFKVKCPPEFERPPLILIAMDGFRYDYIEKWSNYTPAINDLISNGVVSPMRPVFPTNTFPNLYSIVTGLYPISHGIVNNEFLDREIDTEFNTKSEETDETEWYKGEAIWSTAMRQGIKAATFFWPGSDKVRNNKRPTMFREYNESVPFSKRVETVLRWLNMDTGYRAYIYALYLEEPGNTVMKYGPDSVEVGNAIKKVDSAIEILMDGLKDMNLIGCANVILVSDHGISKVDLNKIIKVKELVKNYEVAVKPGNFPVIRPNSITEVGFFNYRGLISDMKNSSCEKQSFIVDFKSKLPKRFHYSNGFRVDVLSAYLEDGWQFTDENDNVKYQSGGLHGGDNSFPDMKAIFIGYGPAFLNDISAPIFDNIELYNLMCEITGIKPANNNGTLGSLNHILRNPVNSGKFPQDVTKESSCNRHSYTGKDYGCYCKDIMRNPRGNKKERANMRAKSYTFNLPFGKPSVYAEDDYCILKNNDYVTAYSKPYKSPLWTSFTLDDYNITDLYNNTCYIQDMRIMYHINLCKFYKNQNDIGFNFLYPVSIYTDNIQNLFETNTSPMYNNFIKVWNVFMKFILKEYIHEYGTVNVMVGPVYDNNSDGNRDSIRLIMNMLSRQRQQIFVPSDYFIILTSCHDKNTPLKDCFKNIRINAFVLPNSNTYYDNRCDDIELVKYVRNLLHIHRVRVRDIELLTEMNFYRDVYKQSSNITFLKTYLD
ncbi:SWPV1-038 [Shearwaterpox virus]|uniref:SWPV1-038 n=1 Tax=Shearwaterpox virus TaxID=1974596 RepID=A0A1V0QGU9_CNPV|nr:SWPV1-038 [Shearwaterpox virus]